MENLVELLMYTVPSAIVGAVAYLVINKFMQAENRRHILDVKKDSLKLTTPIRLQAYERIMLLLERMDPVSVVNRSIKPAMTIKQLHFEIITALKEEVEHNVSQQIYVSADLWDEVRKAKEEALKLVSLVMTQVKPTDSAIDFSRKLIQIQAEKELYTNQRAISVLKKEIKRLF